MKYISFDENITKESVITLIEKITDDCVIYFDSEGGNANAANMFINFTENTTHKITLITTLEICSCAVDVFFFSKTKKVILEGAYAILHTYSRSLEMRDTTNPDYLTRFYIADVLKANNERWNRYAELGLSGHYFDKYAKGENIVITTNELKKMAEKAEQKITH
jgi:ATP-dependent protease ClpP protease subunit